MVTICFYQDSRHETPLNWIAEILGIGYVSRRNDGMTELRINGYLQVHTILGKLIPFIRFKQMQAEALYKASGLLAKKSVKRLTELDLRLLVTYMTVMQDQNYVTRKKKTATELLTILGLTP